MQFAAMLVSSIASLTNYGVATELVSCCENDGTVAGYVNQGLLTISCSGMAHAPLKYATQVRSYVASYAGLVPQLCRLQLASCLGVVVL